MAHVLEPPAGRRIHGPPFLLVYGVLHPWGVGVAGATRRGSAGISRLDDDIVIGRQVEVKGIALLRRVVAV